MKQTLISQNLACVSFESTNHVDLSKVSVHWNPLLVEAIIITVSRVLFDLIKNNYERKSLQLDLLFQNYYKKTITLMTACGRSKLNSYSS